MIIKYHRYFKKSFKKIPVKIRRNLFETIKLFTTEPFHKSLNNHPLKGRLHGLRSINVTGDIRIHYEDHGHFVMFMNIGTHSELYK